MLFFIMEQETWNSTTPLFVQVHLVKMDVNVFCYLLAMLNQYREVRKTESGLSDLRYKKMKGYTKWHEYNLHMLCSIYIVSYLILRYVVRINNMPEILCWYRHLWTFIKSLHNSELTWLCFVIVRLEIETSIPFDSWSWEKMKCDWHFIHTF